MRALVAIGGLVLLGWAASAAPRDAIVVEDWSKPLAGDVGIPVGWEGQSWGRAKYDFRVEAQDSGKALHLRSDGDNSIVSKRVGRIDVKEYPILQWRWRVITLPTGGDSRRPATNDQAAQLYIVFPRFPTSVRSRIIGYVWDSTVPAGAIIPSPSTNMVTYVVVRSGPAGLGKWITESRNVLEDFKRIYGEDPSEPVEAVSIGIDSNDTRSRAESYVGEIVFRKP